MANSAVTYRSARPHVALSVVEVGRHTVRSMIEGRTLQVFAAVLVENGRGTYETQPGGRLACAAPSLLWLPPGIGHTYGPLPGSSWEERWVLFSGPLAGEFLQQKLINPVAPFIALPRNSDVPELFRELHLEVLMRSALGDNAASATLCRLVTRAAIEAELHAPRRSSHVAEMIGALRERASTQLDLADFAHDFGVSTATLRRRFVAATGVPPKVFQLRVRIDRAKELLATTSEPIESIAAQVGFEDSFYFARVFLQREHLTPSQFRHSNHRS